MDWRECYERVLSALERGLVDEADRVTRDCVARYWRSFGSTITRSLLEIVERATGGLGYERGSPLDPAQMVVAGTVIAWPEAVRDGATVLEIGTGIGRTCYVVHYARRPGLYLSIDVSLEVLAIALHANPVPSFKKCLLNPDVKLVLADAVEAVKRLPTGFADHVIHDGGPNPLRAPRLYSEDFLSELYRVMKPCATISVFAGRSRQGREKVYRSLVSAGFTAIRAESFPDSPTFVYRARKPCEEDKA